MIRYIKDNEFSDSIDQIIKNKSFTKTQNTIHHGINKLDHSLRVSYFSYIIAKKLNWDYISAAKGGLLHDFYLSKTNGKSMTKDAIKLTFSHHNIALENASKHFELNAIEKDIIVKHMFPAVIYTIPKYKESILVALVDKFVGTIESLSKFKILFDYKMFSKVIPSFMVITNFLK